MKIIQRAITLEPYTRGFHLITNNILSSIPELQDIQTGWMQVFIQHTSASLTINEDADPSVRRDFERHFNVMIPENAPYYEHNYEGSDDMPAHLKASVLGASVMIPITNGKPNLGTWQGIYLCEHRDMGGSRKIIVTVMGN
jgi:secondary thiamine-phosphate synthase enzyme